MTEDQDDRLIELSFVQAALNPSPLNTIGEQHVSPQLVTRQNGIIALQQSRIWLQINFHQVSLVHTKL